MAYSPGIRAALLSLAALLFLAPASVRADLTQEQVKAAKAATGFVVTGEGSGTAFCISESGLFVTCAHVIEGAGKDISIIVSPAGKQEKRYSATVVKKFKDEDLAILQVHLDPPASVLKLGDISSLFETEVLYVLGYPFGKMLAADEKSNPSISINVGRVTALRSKGAELEAIQLDAQVNPGNSGGPVLDPNGNVVGILVAGLPGRGVNFAIPVSQLLKGLNGPIVTLEAPKIESARAGQPADVSVSLSWILPTREEPKVAIEVRGGGPTRRAPAVKGNDGRYHASIVPVPGAGAEKGKLRLTLDFPSGKVSGAVADRQIMVGGKPVLLSQYDALEHTAGAPDFNSDGKSVGPLPELAALPIDIGGATVTVDARKASRIDIERPSENLPTISCKAVITLADGRVITSEEKQIAIHSPSRPAASVASAVATALEGRVNVEGGRREIALPAAVSDVCAAQDGKVLLLYLKEAKKLAVFDVTELKIRGFIPLAEDQVCFGGGSRYILVVYPSTSLIVRYSVETLEKQKTINNSFGNITSVVMGYASPSLAMLVVSGPDMFRGALVMFDASSMSAIQVQSDRNEIVQVQPTIATIRVSADGRTFGSMRKGISPSGFTVLTFRDSKLELFYEHQSVGLMVPNWDGSQIFTSFSGIYTNKYVPVLKGTGNWAEGITYVPSYHPMYFLGIPYDGVGNRNGRNEGGSNVGIFLSGSSQSLVQINDDFSEMRAGKEFKLNADPITLDKRYNFYPQLNLLITVPPTNDKLVARSVDVKKMLDDRGIDYLYVTSIAPPGRISSHYHFKMTAVSKAGGVTFSLQSGPAGLTVSNDGDVNWDAPSKPAEETVIVSLKDSSGQEAYHTFRLVTTL